MISIRNNQSGFIFVELILTMLVLSIGLASGYVLMDNSLSNSVTGDADVVASQLANEKLEQIISDKSFGGYDALAEGDYPPETLDAPYQNYSRQVDIYEVNPTDMSTAEAGSGYKKVTVSVTWGNHDYETVNVVTLLTNYGT
jgi:Tfp pilus assembly protein PilV